MLHKSAVFKTLFLTAVGIALSGCSTIDRLEGQIQSQKVDVNTIKSETDQRFSQGGLVRLSRPLVIDSHRSALPLEQTSPILSRSVEVHSMGSQTVAEIVKTISRMLGAGIDLREVLQETQATKSEDQKGGSIIHERLQYSYKGSFRGLLDDLTGKVNASWRINPQTGHVEIFRFENRVFGLMLPPGAKKVDASISIGGTGGGASGGSVAIGSNTQINPWQSTLGGIGVLLGASTESSSSEESSMVKGTHGYAIVNRDLAQVIVVARPQTMQRIADYIDQTNKRFARNVLIDVRVIEFQSNDGAQAGIRGDLLMDKAFRSGPLSQLSLGFNGSTISSITDGAPSSVTIGARKDASSSTVTLDSVVQALNSVSRVAVRNQGQIVAINGQPAPFQQANQITYLASTSTTQTPDAGTQTSRTPGSVTVGFTANFIPTVLADNRIMLQYQIQSSSLLGLKTIGSGNDAIQAPEVFSQSLQQQAYLNDGDVIALFGFDQDRSQVANSSGILSKSRSASQNNIQTAVLIQVRVAR